MNDWRYSDEAMNARQRLLKSCISYNGELNPRHYEFCDWVISNGAHRTLDDGDYDSNLNTLYLEWYYTTQIVPEEPN
jgi:hypothetical protein